MSPSLAGGFLTTDHLENPYFLRAAQKVFTGQNLMNLVSGLCLKVRLFPKGLRRIRME